MRFGPDQAYRTSGENTLTVFDLGVVGAMTRLFSERASSGQCSSIGILDREYRLSIIRPYSIRRLAT
jgi:hypothetical protein